MQRTPSLMFDVTVLRRPEIDGFLPSRAFEVDITEEAVIKISHCDKHFISAFVDGEVPLKVLPATQGIRYAKLQTFMNHGPIVQALGGEGRCETSLVNIFLLLLKQGNGQPGVLLRNGLGNCFYSLDRRDTLRAIRIIWDAGGWNISSFSMDLRQGWHAGYQVLGRAA